jgi:hypothetical protein
MVLFYCPPPKPVAADVVYDRRVSGVCGLASLQGSVNVCGGSVSYSAQVAAAGTESITLRLNTGKVIPMRTVHTSLSKKFKQERMSKFEREYTW